MSKLRTIIRNGIVWFFLSLFCSPLLGFGFVGLLPSAADFMPVGYRPCPYCPRTVKVGKEICPYCHADLAGKDKTEKKAAKRSCLRRSLTSMLAVRYKENRPGVFGRSTLNPSFSKRAMSGETPGNFVLE
jgi:hypothetical protein